MHRHSVAFIIAVAALLNAASVIAQDQPPACADDEHYAVLDFWVGEWEVRTAEGQLQGTNRIEKVLNGCAVMEHWTGAGGGAGKSWFYYNNRTGEWRQIWMTSQATAFGGTKEKRLIAIFADGGTRFQGEIPLRDGGVVLDRTTLTPLDDGRVRQVIEISRDGGSTWSTTFDAFYVRKGGG
jgi:hypothetical protein